MTQRPRLKLIAPKQIRLLKPLEYNLEQFKKGDVISVEEFQAKDLVDEKGRAEYVKASEKVESINRFEDASAKVSAKAEPSPEAPVVKDQSGANATPATSATAQTK